MQLEELLVEAKLADLRRATTPARHGRLQWRLPTAPEAHGWVVERQEWQDPGDTGLTGMDWCPAISTRAVSGARREREAHAETWERWLAEIDDKGFFETAPPRPRFGRGWRGALVAEQGKRHQDDAHVPAASPVGGVRPDDDVYDGDTGWEDLSPDPYYGFSGCASPVQSDGVRAEERKLARVLVVPFLLVWVVAAVAIVVTLGVQ